jgi:hypothetical protein
LNQQFVDAMLRRLAETPGVPMPTGAMAHARRHSCGMELAIPNVPLSRLQQLTGHSDPHTTSIYTTTYATELTKTLQTANWLHPARWRVKGPVGGPFTSFVDQFSTAKRRPDNEPYWSACDCPFSSVLTSDPFERAGLTGVLGTVAENTSSWMTSEQSSFQ